PDIKDIVRGFNIPCLEMDGYEADDIIGTLALQAAQENYKVYMVTPDKDYGQLVRENVFIYKPSYQGGGSEILGPEEVCARWNIQSVSQVIDMLGLMGDAVDNIPGIAGIGEKTASKLLATYGSLEAVLEDADNIKGALGEKIRNGKENALLSKKLATIITMVPIEFKEEDYRLKDRNKEILTEVFSRLEFKTLAKRVLQTELPDNSAQQIPRDLFGNPIRVKNSPTAPTELASQEETTVIAEPQSTVEIKTAENTPHDYQLITPEDPALPALIERLSKSQEICFDTETTSIDANQAELVGMSFSIEKGKAYYVTAPVTHEAVCNLLEKFRPVFENENIRWVGQNIKYDMLVLRWYGFTLKGKLYDTMLAHYVYEPEGKRNMDALSLTYLQYQPISIETLIGKGKNQLSMRDVPVELVKEYAAEDADITLQLKHALAPLVISQGVEKILEDIENPLIPVLTDMEYEGVGIDVDFLHQYASLLAKEIQ